LAAADAQELTKHLRLQTVRSLERIEPPRTVEEMRQLYDRMSPEGAGAYDPRTSATGGTPGQTAPSVIRISDADSNQRQATANALAASTMRPDAPSSYASIADYYQNRGAYAAQPGVAGNVIEQLIQVDSRFDRPEMQAWAASNPGLAYELLQNQQMPNVQEAVDYNCTMGTNTENNLPAVILKRLHKCRSRRSRPRDQGCYATTHGCIVAALFL
jgi:hypothetical protein